MSLLMKPGSALLIIGVASLLLRFPIGWVPLIGGLISWMLLLFGVFAVVGGVWLIVLERRAA